MIVLDASVVIAHFDVLDALHARATALLSRHAGEGFRLSAVTRAEILIRPARQGVLAQAQRALDHLAVDTIGLEPNCAETLVRLRAETNLRMPDCCVLLEVERVNAGLATFDARLASAAGARGLRLAV